MTADALARLHAFLADPGRSDDLRREQVVELLASLAAAQTALATMLHTSPPREGIARAEADADRLLAPAEAAERLGVTVRWLYRHARNLPFTRRLSRKTLRFSQLGLERYLAGKPR